MSPWVGMPLVLVTLVGLMLGLRVYGAKREPHPEVLRKLLHVGMGLVTLGFPWVFSQNWPVWTLAGVSAAMLAVAKIPSPLQRKLGGVLDGVERSSLGDIYFPISVALVFTFADGNPVFYCIPILLLTLADAVAALIGVFYGHTHYMAIGGRKSAEGSLAFFAVAFLSTHVPLLLFTSTGRAESLLLGLTIGVLVMLIEAVAWNGLDNLLIPLGGFLLLAGYGSMDVQALVVFLLATCAWVALVFALRGRATLDDAALIGAALAGYLTWSLGGWKWSVAPLLLFVSYNVLWPRKEQAACQPHNAHAVAAICVPGLLWLSVARTYDRWELIYPYTTFYAIQLAFVGIAYLREVRRNMADPKQIVLCSVKGWAVQFLPFALIKGFVVTTVVQAGIAIVPIVLAATAFNRVILRPESYSVDRFPWLRQVAIGVLASSLCLIPLYLWR